MATTDLKGYGMRIRAYARRAEEASDEATRLVATLTTESLLEDTPIDTSRAVSNWGASLGPGAHSYHPAEVPGTKGSTKAAAVAEAFARIKLVIAAYKSGLGRAINIVNTAPYINRLNQGWSTQAPAGFVEAAIQRGRAGLRGFRIFRQ